VNARIAREEAPVAFTGRRGFPNFQRRREKL